MRITLNGDWQFKDYYGEDWRWRDGHKPNSRDNRFWRVGSVPGSVQNDLWRAGELANPYFELNSLLAEWVPARTWIYKRTFDVGEELRGKRIQLRFEGVDYEAEFFMNGESLGQHTGMYTPTMFEVGEKLQFGGENLIAVVIEPAPHEQPQVGRTSKVWTHKSRMTYWWDFCPRVVHVGIWEDVTLDVTDNVRIEDVFVRPQLAADHSRADLAIAVTLDAVQPQNVEIQTTIWLDGEIITSERLQHNTAAGVTRLDLNLPIDQPSLWWTNGTGDQPLYKAEVRVTGGDERTVTFGMRTIEFAPNEDNHPNARLYTVVVNGKKIFAKGWNWVPLDVMYGVPRTEKLEHLFRLAQRAHVNLLRVWGGGLIEQEAFYDLADHYGILIWQEFIQSSSGIDNTPSEAPEHIAMMIHETEQIIPRKRNHPSLALWCGGNELTAAENVPLDDHHALLGALKDVVTRLDPDRLWLPTSPTGPVFGNEIANIERDPQSLHDVHGPWEYQGVTGQYDLYNRSTSLFHSEFGVEGITNLKALNMVIAEEHQLPVSLSNVYWQHLGAWWVKDPMWRKTFGDVAEVKSLIRATQLTQAEGLRYALEADRRRKFHNSGTLPWQFNEPYPMAACTSAVDYYGQAKPVYYAVARAYEPLHVSAKFATMAWAGRNLFEAEVWLNSSHELNAAHGQLKAKIVGMTGHVYQEWENDVGFPSGGAVSIGTVKFPLADLSEDIFFLDLELLDHVQTHARNRYIFTHTSNLEILLNTPLTTLTVQSTDNGDNQAIHITNTGDQAALFVWLEDSRPAGAQGYPYFLDNHFCLFPKEELRTLVWWQGVDPAERALNIGGWNTV